MQKRGKVKKFKKIGNRGKFFYWGVALSIVSLILIIINAFFGIVFKSSLIKNLENSREYAYALNNYGNSLHNELISILNFLCFFWFFIVILLILALISIYQDRRNWFYFFIIGFLALFSFRWLSAILLFIASFLFWKEKKLNDKNKT